MENDFGLDSGASSLPNVDTTYSPEVIPQLTNDDRTALILKEVAASRLNSEIKSRDFYSVCALDAIAGMTDDEYDYRNSREFRILNALHCVSYNKMTDEVKRHLTELTLIAVESMVGKLRISDETYCGVRLFETAYLPESYTAVETPVVVKTPKQSAIARILAGFGIRRNN